MNKKHGPFTRILCVGDFVGTNSSAIDDLCAGKFGVPIMTYFIQGSNPIPPPILYRMANHGEVCPNLAYLGKWISSRSNNHC